jgi:Mn2+/Fe2+ NRAMP family transporter
MFKVVNMNNLILKFLYYLVALIFHCIIFFTNFGNFFHGGTALELIILDSVAVIIVVACIKLFRKTKILERFIIILFALIPAAVVAMGLFLGVKRVFGGECDFILDSRAFSYKLNSCLDNKYAGHSHFYVPEAP